MELDAHERALLDLDRGPGPPGQQEPQELAQVRHVADQERTRELAPLDLLEDLLRVRPRRKSLRLDRLLAGLDGLRDRIGGLPGANEGARQDPVEVRVLLGDPTSRGAHLPLRSRRESPILIGDSRTSPFRFRVPEKPDLDRLLALHGLRVAKYT